MSFRYILDVFVEEFEIYSGCVVSEFWMHYVCILDELWITFRCIYDKFVDVYNVRNAITCLWTSSSGSDMREIVLLTAGVYSYMVHWDGEG